MVFLYVDMGVSDTSTGSSLALDVLIIILPIPVLLKLKLNSKQKVSYIDDLLYRLDPKNRLLSSWSL
jgi:hypothetical protein